MTALHNDDGLTREAMDQLAAANPAPTGELDANADAIYRVITAGAAPGRSSVRPHQLLMAVGGVAVLAVLAVTSFALLGGGGTDGDDGIAADPSVNDPGGFAGSCLAYSEEELLRREFAFRGEATTVSEEKVTFDVSEWYTGDRGGEVTLGLDSSLQSELYNDVTFAEGQEYLVSGDGELAWGCGYTRPFDTELAASWVAVLGGGTQSTGGGAASCAFSYSPETLAERDHAFDGVVLSVEEGVLGPGSIPYPEITFEVGESFNDADSGTVKLLGSGLGSGLDSSTQGPAIEVGGRYLVAGDAEFAWGCGFTRPYSDAAADVWRAAFAD